jgi:hypothetical protein
MTPKDQLYGPSIFAVTGAAAGVAAAMLLRYNRQYDRVYIEDSLPFAAIGYVCGGFVGYCVKLVYQKSQRLRSLIEVVSTALLLGSVGAVLGWLAGDKRWENPPPSMLWGLIAGAVGGVVIGGGRVIWERWRLSRRTSHRRGAD